MPRNSKPSQNEPVDRGEPVPPSRSDSAATAAIGRLAGAGSMSLLPVEDAIARIVGDVSAPLGSEEVALGEAAGRTLARDLAARRSQPPFAASAMDGYAVRAVDVAHGLRLKVIGVAAAGHSFAGKVSEGETVRIFTGAPVPEGADTVLIQEDAEVVGEATIMAQKPVASGRHLPVWTR